MSAAPEHPRRARVEEPLDLVVEELMRRSDDPTWVEVALAIDGNDRQVFVGRWLGAHGNLEPGTPLAAWSGLSPLDLNWRARVPSPPGSLWAEAVTITGEPVTGRAAYTAWKSRNWQ